MPDDHPFRPSDDRRRLRTIARIAEWVAVAAILAVLGYVAFLVLAPDALEAALRREVPGVVVRPSGAALTFAGVIHLVLAAIFVAAMWSARSLFRLFGQAATPFHPAAPALLMRIGLLAIASAVAGIAGRTMIALLMTSANPPGQRELVLGISSGEITALMIGFLMFAFALIMHEGIRLDEDSRSIL